MRRKERTEMEVILLKDVKTLGKAGEIVKVNDGYARNFILKKGFGMEATAKNVNEMKLKKANEDRLEAAVGAMDIQGVLGNGTSHRVLVEAGVEQVARGYAKKVSVNVDGMLTASMYRSGDRIVVESRKTEVYIADGETVDDPAEPQNPGK